MTVYFKSCVDRKTTTEQDHGEFCRANFYETIASALSAGYTIADDCKWIGKRCFDDFEDIPLKAGTPTEGV